MQPILTSVRGAIRSFDAAVTPRRGAKFTRSHVVAALIAILVALTSIWWYPTYVSCRAYTESNGTLPRVLKFNGTETYPSFTFPNPFADAWVANPHLVVIGLPMRSDATCLSAHRYHSQTWGSFPGVAQLTNSFQGLVLPLYLAQAVNATAPQWHTAIQERLNSDGNILIFRLLELPVKTNKTIGSTSILNYGGDAMFTNARKVSLWFRYAYQHFRYTPFLAKADLDTYINIPAYLSVLQQLPRVSTLYGKTRPPHEMLCWGDKPLLYLIGPLYTITRDVAREVFTEPLVMRAFSGPYGNCIRCMYEPNGFVNEDTVHSRALFRRYASTGAQRAFPTDELNDAAAGAFPLPPIVGMGKLYMDHLYESATPMPVSGRVEGLFGYSYNYTLPGPLRRTHLIFVTDNCRARDENTVQPEPYNIFVHRPADEAAFSAQHRKHDIGGGTFTKMPHSSLLEFEDREFYYHVALSSIYCWYDGSLRTDPNYKFPQCWHERPNATTGMVRLAQGQ